jgi:hypothetical protein
MADLPPAMIASLLHLAELLNAGEQYAQNQGSQSKRGAAPGRVPRFETFRLEFAAAIDLDTSRAQSMKRSTTGLRLRSLSVAITIGQTRAGKSTGSIFKSSRTA